jgi:hypothetical protein
MYPLFNFCLCDPISIIHAILCCNQPTFKLREEYKRKSFFALLFMLFASVKQLFWESLCRDPAVISVYTM